MKEAWAHPLGSDQVSSPATLEQAFPWTSLFVGRLSHLVCLGRRCTWALFIEGASRAAGSPGSPQKARVGSFGVHSWRRRLVPAPAGDRTPLLLPRGWMLSPTFHASNTFSR